MKITSESNALLLLIPPQVATATVTGSAVQFTPNNDPRCQATAIAMVGGTPSAPTSFTVIYTITQSATSGGTYTTTATLPTATGTNENQAYAVTLDTTKPFIKGVATIAFVGGSTPSVCIGLSILVKQNNASASNGNALS